jgi:16S rRNA processing protein RimM
VHDFGAGDVLEIEPGEGRATFFLPFTRDNVPEVDLGAGRLTAAPPNETE